MNRHGEALEHDPRGYGVVTHVDTVPGLVCCSSMEALARYLAKVGWSRAEIARRAGVDRAVVTRGLNGKRPFGRLAASEIARATADAFVSGETKELPLTREQLCPKLAKRAA